MTSPDRVPPLVVSIHDEVVVIEPPADIDVDATDALRSAVAAVVDDCRTAMIALDPEVACAPSEWPHPASPVDDDAPAGCATSTVAAGFLRLCAGAETWTLDLARRRFCRSASAVNPRFVSADQWTAILAVWIRAGRTTVLTQHGVYVSTTSNWAA